MKNLKTRLTGQDLSLCKYSLSENGRSIVFRHTKGETAPWGRRFNHVSSYETLKYDTFANRALCREWVVVTAGDEPVAALTVTNPEPSLLAYRHTLGELSGTVGLHNQTIAFADADILDIEYAPGASVYRMQFSETLVLRMEVSLLEDDGMVALVCVERAPAPVAVNLSFGGMQHVDRGQIDRGSWYVQGQRAVKNHMEIVEQSSQRIALLSSVADPDFDWDGRPPMTERCHVTVVADTPLVCEAANGYALSTTVLEEGGVVAVTATYERADHVPATRYVDSVAEATAFADACKRRREAILDKCSVQTPSTVLQAGLLQNVLDLDSARVGRGWFEMRQWWNAYIVNNYQISAAAVSVYHANR